MDNNSLIIKLGLDTADSKKRVAELNRELKSMDKEIKSLDTSTDNFEDNMTNMGKKIDLTKTSIVGFTEKLEEQNKELDKAGQRLSKARKDLEDYARSGGKSAEKMADLKRKVVDAQVSFNKIQREVNQTERALEDANNRLAEMEKQLRQMPFDNLSKQLSDCGEKLGDFASMTAPLSASLVGLGTVGVNAFIDMEGSLVKVKNMLGLTDEEAEKLYESARNLASKGFAEFDEVLNTLSNVKLTMGDLIDDSQLEDFSKGVLSISQTFDADLNDVLKASNMLMSNFGITGGEALDIIGYGFQNGLNYSDDFLDTLWEYSVQFADMGFSAKEFASILEVGMQKGIFNTDKLADAVKEANIRLKEMPEATGEAVKTLGLNVEQIQSDIAKGGDTAQQAMIDVCEAIMSIEDPIKRNQVGVEIFGTMWEDCGDAVAQAVAGAKDDIDGLDGVINDMNNNIEQMNDGGLAQLKTKLTEAFEVIGKKLIPVFSDLIDKVVGVVDWFTDLDESTQGTLITFGALLASISPITGALGSLANGLSNTVGLFGKISGAINESGGIINAFKNLGSSIGASTGTGVTGALSSLATAFLPMLATGALVSGVVMGIHYLVQNYDTLKDKITGTSEKWDYGNSLMAEATRLFAEEVKGKYETAQKSIEQFDQNAIQLLIDGTRTLNEDGTNDFSSFLNACQTEMEKAKISINGNAQELTNALTFLNTDIATVFSVEDLALIQERWSGQMTAGLETAYDNLETTIIEKDKIIEGLMKEHGYDYETAYAEWESNVLRDYNIFCDELMKAQTGYQEDSLGSVEQFLMEQELLRTGDLTKIRNQVRDSYDARIDQTEREYQVLQSKILQGESVIDGIYFESTEQAQRYADLVRDYKIAQLEVQKEEEIQIATDLAYERGLISKAEYDQLTKDSQDRLTVRQNEVDGLTSLIEAGAEGIGGAWEYVWEAIQRADEAGIPASLTRNKEFTDELTRYFENGGTDIQDAIVQAYDKITGTTDESVKEISTSLNNLDTTTKKNMDNVITYMNDMGLSLEDACALYGIDTELMEGYIRQLAFGIEGSTDDINNNFEETGTSALSLQGDIEEGASGAESAINALNRDSKPAFQGVQEMMDDTGQTSLDMGDDVDEGTDNAVDGIDTLGNASLSDVQDELDETGWSAIDMGDNVETGCADAKSAIDSVEGKEENVVVNFLSNGFSSVMSNLRNFVSTVIGAKNAGKSDSSIEPINFGDDYMQNLYGLKDANLMNDLYGLKDAGIKTISLASLGMDEISAVASKDGSSIVSGAVANYNYNNSNQSITYEIPFMTQQLPQQQDRDINININIENMNGTEQDINKLMKQIDQYVRLHGKKW